jgi:hypothetical protein
MHFSQGTVRTDCARAGNHCLKFPRLRAELMTQCAGGRTLFYCLKGLHADWCCSSCGAGSGPYTCVPTDFTSRAYAGSAQCRLLMLGLGARQSRDARSTSRGKRPTPVQGPPLWSPGLGLEWICEYASSDCCLTPHSHHLRRASQPGRLGVGGDAGASHCEMMPKSHRMRGTLLKGYKAEGAAYSRSSVGFSIRPHSLQIPSSLLASHTALI